MQQQQQLTITYVVADSLKLQQQLSDAQALVDSAQANTRKPQKQLVNSSELDDKKEQLAEAQAAAESASADIKQVLQQQRIELQDGIELLSGASCFAQS